MMRRDTFPMSCRRHALHPPSTISAAIKTAYPVKSFDLRFISFDRLAMIVVCLIDRDHLHRGVAHFIKKAVDDRPVPQNVPTRTRRLSEDDVRDPLTSCEVDQSISHLASLQFHDICSELASKLNVLLKRCVIFRFDTSHLLARRL